MKEAISEFRRMMRDRKNFARGTADHEYRTRAARKLVWLINGVPVSEWDQ